MALQPDPGHSQITSPPQLLRRMVGSKAVSRALPVFDFFFPDQYIAFGGQGEGAGAGSALARFGKLLASRL